jgi:hypothetical protein
MSRLEIALWKRIIEIVNREKRYFDYLDFVPKFIVGGQVFSISYGTFRNKISSWVIAEKLEIMEYSPQAFYTLKGTKFEHPMTRDHTGALIRNNIKRLSNDPVYRIIQNIPFGHRAVHDIRLRFEVKGIYQILASECKGNPESYDIQLTPFPWKIMDLDIGVTVHSTDTVSLSIGCSYSPVATDVNGAIRLSKALSTVQERLSNILSLHISRGPNHGTIPVIPDHMTWTVTMWHFGADALKTYAGENFYVSWEVAQHALITAYSKDWKDGKRRVRIEKQEYPQKSLAEALEEKLNAIR